jgi:hypothetical protein
MSKPKRVTARKYMGDDEGSWAVFVDGHPAWKGLTRREVPYYKKKEDDRIKALASMKRD